MLTERQTVQAEIRANARANEDAEDFALDQGISISEARTMLYEAYVMEEIENMEVRNARS